MGGVYRTHNLQSFSSLGGPPADPNKDNFSWPALFSFRGSELFLTFAALLPGERICTGTKKLNPAPGEFPRLVFFALICCSGQSKNN